MNFFSTTKSIVLPVVIASLLIKSSTAFSVMTTSTDLIEVTNYSFSPLTVGPPTNNTFYDAQGNKLRRVVCGLDKTVCEHFTTRVTIAPMETKVFGYQGFNTDINEPGGTKNSTFPLVTLLSDGNDAHQLDVIHKSKKSLLDFKLGFEWQFTEFGAWTSIIKTYNWQGWIINLRNTYLDVGQLPDDPVVPTAAQAVTQ